MKDKTKKALLAIFIVVIMASSILGFIGNDENTKSGYKYKNIDFVKSEQGWIGEINGKQFVMDYKIDELNDINVPEINLNQEKVYLVYDYSKQGDLNRGLIKLNYVLNLLGKIVLPACDREENCPDIPVKNCSNTNNMIYLKFGENKVYNEENCLVISGDILSINKEIDKVNLKLLNII